MNRVDSVFSLNYCLFYTYLFFHIPHNKIVNEIKNTEVINMDPEKLNEYEREQSENNMTNNDIPDGAIAVESKQVVVYDYNDMVEILTTLNEKTPIVGIDSMRNIIKIFDIINAGVPQNAYVDPRDGKLIDPSMVQTGPINFPVKQENTRAEFVSEGDVVEEA